MKGDNEFTDEFLNAFVDDQLTAEEKAEAYAHVNRDAALNMRVCELRKMHDLVQLAYRDPPRNPARGNAGSGHIGAHLGTAASIAVSVAIVIAAALGWPFRAVDSNVTPATTANAPLATTDGQVKVLFHLNSGEPAHMKEALNEVENLLQYYRKKHQSARVELVTNGTGINLLRADVSPYVDRVKRMQREYDNLTFVACQNSLDILSGELGVAKKLIPGTVLIDSGVAQIMRRQQQGWAYIQV